jgi:hypothetical protein
MSSDLATKGVPSQNYQRPWAVTAAIASGCTVREASLQARAGRMGRRGTGVAQRRSIVIGALLLLTSGATASAAGESFSLAGREPAGEGYAVVVSRDVPVDDLSMDALRDLFLFASRRWADGQPVTVVYSEEALGADSCLMRLVYRMDYAAVRRLILQKLNRGELDLAPKVVSSDEAAAALVGVGSNLLTLVRASAANGATVKILAIDGKLPHDPGYPLRR